MSKKETVKKTPHWWLTQIDLAKKFRKKYGKWDIWKDLKDYMRNNFDDNLVTYNLMQIMLRTNMPRLYYKDPYVMVRPDNARFVMQCRLRETMLNNVVRKNGTKHTMRDIAANTWMFGRGPGIVGYDIGQEDGEEFEDILIGSPEFERNDYNVYKKPNVPWFSSIHPDNHLVAPFTRDITNTPWAAHGIMMSYDRLRKMADRYPGIKRIDGSHLPDDWLDADRREVAANGDIGIMPVYFWEIHDFEEKKVLAVVEGVDQFLMPPADDPSQDDDIGLPFVSCTFMKDSDYYWNVSNAMLLEGQQLEANEVRTQLAMFRRMALLKFLYTDGLFEDEEAIEELVNGNSIMAAIKVTQRSPKDYIHEFKPNIPPELYPYLEQLIRDVRDMEGVGRNQAGDYESKSHIPATQSALVQQGFEMRMDEKVDAIGDTLLAAVVRMDRFITKYWKDENTIKVMGYDGKAYWVTYSSRDMRGEYEIDIDRSSMVKPSPQQKKVELATLITQFQNNPNVNITYLMRMLLQEYRYIDVLEALPEAQQAGPMNAQEFMRNQSEMRAQLMQGGGQNIMPMPQQGAV